MDAAECCYFTAGCGYDALEDEPLEAKDRPLADLHLLPAIDEAELRRRESFAQRLDFEGHSGSSASSCCGGCLPASCHNSSARCLN